MAALTPNTTPDSLLAENAELRARLEESEETLRAIRAGEVDALIVDGSGGPQVFILQSSDADSNRFRSDILAKVTDAVIAIDENERIIYLNAAAEQQYGVTSSDTLGKRECDIYESRWSRPEEREAAATALRNTGHWLGENIHVKLSGEVIHVESSVSRLHAKDGTPAGLLSVIRDVSGRSASEAALRESEERYRTLFESIDEGFCIIELIYDEEGKVVDYIYLQTSPSFEKQSGLHNAQGRRIRDMVPNHEQRWFDLYAQVALTGESVRVEQRAEGLNRWFDVHASRFGDPAKHQVAVLFNDTTERKNAEEALRRNEALFSTIINQAPGGVYVIDDRFRVFQVSAPGRSAFERAEPVIGRDFTEVMHILWGEELGSELAAIFRHTLTTGEPYFSPRFTAWREDLAEEKSYDWETHRLTLPSGRHGVVCYFSDTTEAARAAEALRQSEARANNIIQSITDGFITMDREWRMTYLSSRGEEILRPLQKTASNVLGKVFWDEFPHSVGTDIEENYRRSMDEQVPVQFETFYPPLGRWFDLRVYPSPTGISLYFLDITERKQAEEALRASEQALRTADRSKDEFLAMLAHELRNPLAPLRNAAEILHAGGIGAGAREHAQGLISRQIENMSRMIDDLLDVSRITEGKIELRKEPVALESILVSAADVARASSKMNRQTLVVSLPAKPIVLNADATRLEQVLGNLLGNACKYSGEGSHITLSAERVPAAVPPEVMIKVADNGIGISPELLPRVFELFVQASRTLDRAHGGLGIGLTIVHRLVNLHGGSIEARSDGLGTGTEFIVRLPILDDAALLPSSAASAPAVQRPLRMLIVDDNRDSAESMALLQELHGHETRVAHNGADAVALAGEYLPEVVLLDIGLPGMDGFEVARRLRGMPGIEGAFLVALTGYGSEDDRERAKSAGFDKHLVKPADLKILQAWLRERP